MIENIQPFLLPVIFIVGSVMLGYLLRWIIGTVLHGLARRTPFKYDEIVFACLKNPVVLATILVGIRTALRRLPDSDEIMVYATPTLEVAFALLATITAASIARQIIRQRSESAANPHAATGLIQKIVQICIIAVGLAVILNVFGVSVTAIVTALGVGGLAVALALQDTLSNLFAGVYILLANQIRVGDYIKVGVEGEGWVQDITWRTTTIKQLDANLVIYPNNKLSQAVVINLNLPEKLQRVRIEVGVAYDSDPDHVERTLRRVVMEHGHHTVEEAIADEQPEGKIPGLLVEPEPLIRLLRFDPSSLAFLLQFSVYSFELQAQARHEIMKRLLAEFRNEEITIPFPIQTVQFGNMDIHTVQEAMKPLPRGD